MMISRHLVSCTECGNTYNRKLAQGFLSGL